MTKSQALKTKRTLASFLIVWLSMFMPGVSLAETEAIGFNASNSETGPASENEIEATVEEDTTTTVDNDVVDETEIDAIGFTGGNTANKNGGEAEVDTGDAAIGVTSLKNDNTTVLGGQAGLDVSGHKGDHEGDYEIQFGSGTADLSSGNSYQAVNDATGANSDNTIGFTTKVTETTEVQNDGKIVNLLDLVAITGQNEASMNTGGGTINTGDADVAATLVNLLNTTVVDGNLMVSVADIFGDLIGDVVLPDLNALVAALTGGTTIVAANEDTGSDSTNEIDINLKDTETTKIANEADINTVVNAEAITGQNETGMNTGGGLVDTGDASVSASNISVANTTVEGGNWGLVIVNALNKWLGFMVGDNGEVKALSQEETIEAINRDTGADSNNEIAISDERERNTLVDNKATIDNVVNAQAITGQNTANFNTGAGDITTGDANIEATAVNIANTTVKDGSLFIAVVNVLGDWFGDLLYNGESLTAQAEIEAANKHTGAGSENTIDVDIERRSETDIDNNARIATTLNAEVDTGNNTANKNTKGGSIETGDGVLALHSRTVANLVGLAVDPALGVEIQGLNKGTGYDSKNTIKATLNDERIIAVDNFADVSTIFASLVNTGNNEASYNTLGGHIGTGDIGANVGIHNLINQVILALAGGDELVLDAEFFNLLTGAYSENTNELETNYDFLADVKNRGLVNNLIDLILNTGGNAANYNTLSEGGSIVTGGICASGDVDNDVNSHTFGLGRLWSLNADNDGEVNNDANIDATTGNNEMIGNTHDGKADSREGCRVAAADPDPGLPVGGGETGEDQGGSDDGEESSGSGSGGGDDDEVAGTTTKSDPAPRVNGGKKLRRFPVAGGEVVSAWTPGRARAPWQILALAAAGLVGGAYQLDRLARRRRLTMMRG